MFADESLPQAKKIFGPPTFKTVAPPLEATRAYFNVPAGTFVPGEMKNVPGDLAVRA